jgi:hypothetical protein
MWRLIEIISSHSIAISVSHLLDANYFFFEKRLCVACDASNYRIRTCGCCQGELVEALAQLFSSSMHNMIHHRNVLGVFEREY